MPDLEIDIDVQINQLKNRWKDLNELWVDPPGPTADDKTDQSRKINFWMTQINEKITSLERIKTNKKASQVIIRCLTDEEKRRAEEAMQNLSRAIQRAQVWDNIVKDVTTILNSATTVNTTAGRGEPKKG